MFNGCGLAKNAVAWIGTESGHAPYPVWNTQDGCPSGAGTPDGASYVPKEVDLTLQNSDTWFYKEGMGYRSLSEMVAHALFCKIARFVSLKIPHNLARFYRSASTTTRWATAATCC